MKIGLIAMSGVRVKNPELAALGLTLPQFVNRGKVIASLPSLGLLTVAALTPEGVEVAYREIPEWDPDADLEWFDLVAISSFTAQIHEAYRLADAYRSKGVPVVMGGLHVTLSPQEAACHADSIVLHGAEGAWPRLIEDFRKGCMKPCYEGLRKGVFEDGAYVVPRFDLLRGRAYNRITIQTSRGCPWRCEFCAASLHLTDGFQQKPVGKVLREFKSASDVCRHPFYELADDNTFLNKTWAKAFLRAIRPLGIQWFTETDISIAEDDELLGLLSESGCRQVLIGLESPENEDLRNIDPGNWKFKKCDHYLKAIEKIQTQGVSVNGCFILGLDSHTPDIFEKISSFIQKSNLLEAQLTVLTPFPGTPLFNRLKQEGRLLADEFWDACTLFDVNYQPKRMSVSELEQGLRWLFGQVYKEEQLNRRQRHYMEIIKRSMEGDPGARISDTH